MTELATSDSEIFCLIHSTFVVWRNMSHFKFCLKVGIFKRPSDQVHHAQTVFKNKQKQINKHSEEDKEESQQMYEESLKIVYKKTNR